MVSFGRRVWRARTEGTPGTHAPPIVSDAVVITSRVSGQYKQRTEERKARCNKMIEGSRLRPELGARISQWAHICSEFAVKGANGIRTGISYQCASNTNLRFIHTLEHPKAEGQLPAKF
jgi:hypothetical protein